MTHIFRGVGAFYLQNSGLTAEQIARLGLWEGFNRLDRNYLAKFLPLIAMLHMAGYVEEKDIVKAMQAYTLPRSTIQVRVSQGRMA